MVTTRVSRINGDITLLGLLEGSMAFFDWVELGESEVEAHSLAWAEGREVKWSMRLVRANHGESA